MRLFVDEILQTLFMSQCVRLFILLQCLSQRFLILFASSYMGWGLETGRGDTPTSNLFMTSVSCAHILVALVRGLCYLLKVLFLCLDRMRILEIVLNSNGRLRASSSQTLNCRSRRCAAFSASSSVFRSRTNKCVCVWMDVWKKIMQCIPDAVWSFMDVDGVRKIVWESDSIFTWKKFDPSQLLLEKVAFLGLLIVLFSAPNIKRVATDRSTACAVCFFSPLSRGTLPLTSKTYKSVSD